MPTMGIQSGLCLYDPNLRCDLLEVRRVSGGNLIIRWQLTNTNVAAAPSDSVSSEENQIHYNPDWSQLYFIDPTENKKYGGLTDSDNKRIWGVFWGNLSAGQQRLNWAKFPAPPATSTRISITIPDFVPFEDVPVLP